MKVLISLLLAFSLSGCYQAVNSWDIERATKICGGLENVVEVSATWDGTEHVQCKEGKERRLDSQ